MAALEDVDKLIEKYDLALGEFVKGTPSRSRSCSPIEMT